MAIYFVKFITIALVTSAIIFTIGELFFLNDYQLLFDTILHKVGLRKPTDKKTALNEFEKANQQLNKEREENYQARSKARKSFLSFRKALKIALQKYQPYVSVGINRGNVDCIKYFISVRKDYDNKETRTIIATCVADFLREWTKANNLKLIGNWEVYDKCFSPNGDKETTKPLLHYDCSWSCSFHSPNWNKYIEVNIS